MRELIRLRQAVRTSRRVHLISSAAFLWLGIYMLRNWENVERTAAITFTLFGAFEAIAATQLLRRPHPWALVLASVSTLVGLAIALWHIDAGGLFTLPPRYLFDLLVVFGVLTLHWDAVPTGTSLELLKDRPELWRGATATV